MPLKPANTGPELSWAPGHAPRASVLLHGEPIVLPGADSAGAGNRPSLLSRLLAAPSAEERQHEMRAALHGLGFDWLGYGRLVRIGPRVVPVSFCLTYAEATWARQYFGERYHSVDPRLQDALESSLPTVWTLEELAQRDAPEAEWPLLRRFLDGLRRSGARSGVMLALPGTPVHQRHFISLLSRTAGSAWIDDALLGRVLTLALCLHEFYTRYAVAPQAGPAAPQGELTALQCEILARVARGMPDKLIASQLNLTLHNVDYHLRRLRKRFGVHNRVQLTQAAMRHESLPGAAA
ncbi:LuxR family transcriptional regulator [Ideonella sp. BN130291]|nr:LuxR family transcriptional regulator [Ideonella sp. BN130291]